MVASVFNSGCFPLKQLLFLLEQVNCVSEWQVSPRAVRLEAVLSIKSKLVGNNWFYASPSLVLPDYKRTLSYCLPQLRKKGLMWLTYIVLSQNSCLLLNEGNRERGRNLSAAHACQGSNDSKDSPRFSSWCWNNPPLATPMGCSCLWSSEIEAFMDCMDVCKIM